MAEAKERVQLLHQLGSVTDKLIQILQSEQHKAQQLTLASSCSEKHARLMKRFKEASTRKDAGERQKAYADIIDKTKKNIKYFAHAQDKSTATPGAKSVKK